MKLTALVAACIIQYASAHYFFDTLIIDGAETKPLQYVRENTRQAKYNPTKWKNIRDDMTPDMEDFRCNKGAFESASRTSTAEVKAGAKLGMKLAVGATMQHPGPALVYMSKAPTTAQAYEGDGDWFKIFEESTCKPSGDFGRDAWCTWDKDNVSFTIPAGTPDGEYLIRAEHIGVHGAHDGQAEFYYSCAQVKVTGGTGTTLPTDTIKFPGGYKKDDPSFNFSIYGGFKEYPMPGPAVWDGTSTGGSAPSNSTSGSSVPSSENKSTVVAHDDSNCESKNVARRHARAFRQ
ncbi:hypothetical protein N0V87_003879 [Didymella glomerata]|uniref:AA9 family lytic polysaccharide monooxygenase n=1 Tax=Didymella glomerata TaxID=749621 RepID=A0A9W9C111_9PLEO|nr:hypothetical protein N0V87_003879 [Didymella glomerata]